MTIDMLDNRKGYEKWIRETYIPKTTDKISPADGYDLVVVPTKPYQLVPVLKTLTSMIGSADYFLLTQNWEGTAEIDALVSRDRYAFGDAKAGGVFDGDVLIATIFPTIDIGQPDGKSIPALQKTAELYESIGIKPHIKDDILEYIWVQYAIVAGLWPAYVRVGSLTGLLKDKRNSILSLDCARECLEVAKKRGIDLKKYPDAAIYMNKSIFLKKIAGVMLSLFFKFNESVRRSSAHGAGDAREVMESYEYLMAAGQKLDVEMPAMKSFRTDMERLSSKNSL
jgi:ketopantoate reductase